MKYLHIIEHLNLPRKVESLKNDPISWPIIEAWFRIQGIIYGQEQATIDEHNEQRAGEYVALADIAVRIRNRLSLALNKEISCSARLGTWEEDFHQGIDGYLVFGNGVTEIPVDVTSASKKLNGIDSKKGKQELPRGERYIVFTDGNYIRKYTQATDDILARSRRKKGVDISEALMSIHNHDRLIGKSTPHTFCNQNPYKHGPSVNTMNLLVHDNATLQPAQIRELTTHLTDLSRR